MTKDVNELMFDLELMLRYNIGAKLLDCSLVIKGIMLMKGWCGNIHLKEVIFEWTKYQPTCHFILITYNIYSSFYWLTN